MELKSVFEHLQLLLRYIASGLVGIIAASLLDGGCRSFCENLSSKSPWTLLALAATLGTFIYAIHQSLFDKILYLISIKLYFYRHKLSTKFIGSISLWRNRTLKDKFQKYNRDKNPWNVRFGLFSQTYLRRKSEDLAVRNIQNEMDKKLALLNFLYCSSYSLLFISFLFLRRFYLIKQKDLCIDKIFLVLFLGIIAFVGAFLLDYRITKREMWMVEFFYQPVPDDGSLDDKNGKPKPPQSRLSNILRFFKKNLTLIISIPTISFSW